jgi:CIC family chloride channel protein
MVFEMTGDYGLILPLMLTSVVAYLVARKLHPESVYTEWLVRRGIVLTHGADAALLVRVTVGEGAISRAATVAPDVTLTEMLGLMEREPQELYPVVSRSGQLLGSLAPEQVRQAAREKPDAGATLTAAQLMRTDPEKVRSEETLLDVLRRMVGKDVRVLPAVSADDASRYIGVVTRAALFREYDRLRLADHP